MHERVGLPRIKVAFDDDPSVSPTLPGEYYIDPGVFEAEKVSVFYRTWQFVCHVSRLKEPGQYLVFDLHDQSIIVLRSPTGALQAFHNVCQHRAHRLLEGEGTIPGSIVCRYHRWAYRTDGRLVAARRADQVDGLLRDDVCLAKVLVQKMAGLVFINLDLEAASLEETYPGLEDEIRSFCPTPEELNFAYTKKYPLAANWKISVENYSECYHCPGCHPSLTSQAIDLKDYSITTRFNYHMHLSHGQIARLGYPAGERGGRSDYFGAWFIWPNVCVEFYPGGYMNVLHHRPVGPEATTQVVEWYCAGDRPTADEQRVIDFVAVTREEDLPICESVQRGLHSRGYSQGRFVVDPDRRHHSEHAVHDFQRMVLNHLTGGSADQDLSWSR